MKVITPGHRYELDHFESYGLEGCPIQTLQFIEKKAGEKGNMVTVNDGTTNEEVLRVLLDRLRYLNDKHACRENVLAITDLESALDWLEKRTADRKARQVEGTEKTNEFRI